MECTLCRTLCRCVWARNGIVSRRPSSSRMQWTPRDEWSVKRRLLPTEKAIAKFCTFSVKKVVLCTRCFLVTLPVDRRREAALSIATWFPLKKNWARYSVKCAYCINESSSQRPMRLRFLRSEFRGLLPKYFPDGRFPSRTRAIPTEMNDANKEETTRWDTRRVRVSCGW